MNDADRELALVVADEVKPQELLLRPLKLQLNYQFGLEAVACSDIDAAMSKLLEYRECVRCICILGFEAVESQTTLTALNANDHAPLLFCMPDEVLEQQRLNCAEMSTVYFCSWEEALGTGENNLRQVVEEALTASEIGDLFVDLETETYSAAKRRVNRRLKNISTLPTLPEIIARILQTINEPRSTVAELEDLLCRDPAIVVKLLQVMKSPAFAGTGRKSSWSLPEVITRLGLKKVGALAQQVKLINSLVRPEDSAFDLLRFWEHSVGCALIIDKLYHERLIPHPISVPFHEYWTAALLHDVGKLVLGFFYWGWFARVAETMGGSVSTFHEAETQLGSVANHERLSKLLLLNADMGEGIVQAVGNHHALREDSADLDCLLHIANGLCKDLGLGYFTDEAGEYDPEILDRLEMSAEQMEVARDTLASDIVPEIKQMVVACL